MLLSLIPTSCQCQSLWKNKSVFACLFERLLTAKFDEKHTLKLAEDLSIGDGFAWFVILKDWGFLVDLLSNILLGELELETSVLDGLREMKFQDQQEDKETKNRRTLPTEGATFAGGATSFSRSSFAIRWWSVPANKRWLNKEPSKYLGKYDEGSMYPDALCFLLRWPSCRWRQQRQSGEPSSEC